MRILCLMLLTYLLQSRKHVFNPLEVDKKTYLERINQTLQNYSTAQKLFREFSHHGKSFIHYHDIKLIGVFTQPLTQSQLPSIRLHSCIYNSSSVK